MTTAEFHLRWLGDPRLALHASSALPAWLWSLDGTRIIWGNAVGAKLFGATNAAGLCEKAFGPAEAHRRQVAMLARSLPPGGALRLERLRGFGAPLGALVTCGCARLKLDEASEGILIAAAESVGARLSLGERMQWIVEQSESPIVAFGRDGMFAAGNEAARPLLGFANLSEAGLEQAGKLALIQGSAEISDGFGQVLLQRVGAGADLGFIALIAPLQGAASHSNQPKPASPQATGFEPAGVPVAATTIEPMPNPERAPSQALAEFELVDEFAESFPERTAECASSSAPREPELPVLLLPENTESSVEMTGPSATAHIGEDAHEPPPFVEAVTEESSPPLAQPSDETGPDARRYPLRFMWQMDAEGRFSIGSDEFTRLIGMRTAAGFGRLWSEIEQAFALDPENLVRTAVATRATWSGVILNWPVDGGDRLPVELSGLPVYDRLRNFLGYRGFGVCRDVARLRRLASLRRYELIAPTPEALSPDPTGTEIAEEPPVAAPPDLPTDTSSGTSQTTSPASSISAKTDLETPVETPKNVLPFRPIGEQKSPTLTAGETSAFDELARQLSAQLQGESGSVEAPEISDGVIDKPERSQTPEISEQPQWLAHPEPAPRGEGKRDRMLLDLLPVGVLIYRLDRLLYANAAFLDRMGFSNLHALEEVGGLDALYVEAGGSGSSTSGTGTPVTISGPQAGSEPPSAIDARLYTITWDDESALALIFSGAAAAAVESIAPVAAAPSEAPPAVAQPAVAPPAPSAVGHANAEELGAILDTTTDGIVMFDERGNLNSCNRSAEALFGYDGDELVNRNLTDLFAPESRRVVSDYLETIKAAGLASLLDHGRDVLGRASRGGIIPLSMTMGRTRADGPNFFAVFRDLSQTRKSESELQQARRLADRAANTKADLLARISHEVRTPLNAIIGFAEVMMAERFGPLGNARYIEYMKDIRASGEHVVAIINDLLDLSRIETGKLDLTFASQNLNDIVEQCVAMMQPEANRQRIIIRSSLGQALPPVVADATALRQIALNLIGNSIHLANPGGQVIVSTALSDFGEIVFRVRDTGHGLSDNEVAAAMEPFRTQAPSDQAAESSGVNLSLTKALVEANRAQFQIKTGAHSGTLVEVLFPQEMART
jgi:PAS domain S-box-containing protein